MGRFSFRVEASDASTDGFDGVMLAGPVLERGCGFSVGDVVIVPTEAGPVLTTCLAVVLARWGAGREDWLTITVDPLDPEQVSSGGVAYSERE